MVNRIAALLGRISGLIGRFSAWRSRLNTSMRTRYSPNRLAGIVTAVCGALAVLILFVPNYLGMGNDSVAYEKMGIYRLAYLEKDLEDFGGAENAFFTRVYALSALERGAEFSIQGALVSFAKALDWFFTQDRLFDIRFLAFLYLILYLPGVFLVVKAALERVKNFSESLVLAVLGGIIFSDITYVAYFNSLYPDALLFILLLYMAGCALLLHRESGAQNLYALLLGLASVGFSLAVRRGYLGGVVMAFFMLMQLRHVAGRGDRALYVTVTTMMLMATVISFLSVKSEFDDTGKYHAMTRGVLLQSDNPARALEGMGIDVSYSVLAEDSLYAYYPTTQLSNPLIEQEFLGRYSQSDIALYYVSHPGSLLAMWDLGVKAAVNLRRDYCGNYEYSVGMPPMSKSLMCSVWSIFKQRSAPKTIGYVLVLLIAVFLTTGKKLFVRRAHATRWEYTHFMTCVCLLTTGMADMTYVIMHSGDAQLIQYNIVLGAVLDILLYFVAAELLHHLNVLEEDRGIEGRGKEGIKKAAWHGRKAENEPRQGV